jgi:hypothetical protein
MEFRQIENLFLERFYEENEGILIGPNEDSFKPPYKESKLINGKIINNKPIFSFKFGLIVTNDGCYSKVNGIFKTVDCHKIDLKITSIRMSIFSFSKTHFLTGGSNQQFIEISESQFNDLDIFYKFIKEYKIFYENYSNNEKLIKSKDFLGPKILKKDYQLDFKNKLIDMILNEGKIGGLDIFLNNDKIHLKGLDWFNLKEISNEIIFSDKIISEYLIGLLGHFLKNEIRYNQLSDNNVLIKYLNHEQIKSTNINLLVSFSEIQDVKKQLSFLKEFVVGKSGGFLNEKRIKEFEQLESLIELVREYNSGNIDNETSQITQIQIVEIYSKILEGLSEDTINKNDEITKNFIRVETKLKDREKSINFIIENFLSIKDLGLIKEIKNQIEIQKFQFEHLVYISCELVKSYEMNDKLTFYRIYENLDKLQFFNSTWEIKMVSEIELINDKLDELLKKINQLEKNIVISIQGLNEELGEKIDVLNSSINYQLKEIDSSLMLGNWINLVNTIQNYKVRKNTELKK